MLVVGNRIRCDLRWILNVDFVLHSNVIRNTVPWFWTSNGELTPSELKSMCGKTRSPHTADHRLARKPTVNTGTSIRQMYDGPSRYIKTLGHCIVRWKLLYIASCCCAFASRAVCLMLSWMSLTSARGCGLSLPSSSSLHSSCASSTAAFLHPR